MNRLTPLSRLGIASMLLLATATFAAEVRVEEQAPVSIRQIEPNVWLVDFGRVAFGNIEVAPQQHGGRIIVHFGESQAGGRVNRQPPGTVRYARVEAALGREPVVIAPPPDARNTKQPAAILTPPEWGVILPFRWVEIEGWPGELEPRQIRRRAAFDATWDDRAAAFRCSDEMLSRVWDLCHYSIKATTFAGVFVDGDRERIPYEADAYLNQLSYYACNPDPRMARDTFDRLMAAPTWPTEWAPHMIFMAYADWMQTGDRAWLEARFDRLKPKLLEERAGPDGLLTSTAEQIRWGDIVDWPAAERDGFEFTPVNTVVNAFYLRALDRMVELAQAIGREAEAAKYRVRERQLRVRFQEQLFDAERGLFRDGFGSTHSSLHANLFPLAFGLVPAGREPEVARWLASRGMACSVYAAQYLLEGLFEAGAINEAVSLMLAPGDRSWRHMVESGTTITWEAWDQRYKPNQDWNHAWGAAPANLLPRYLLGVRSVAPGWRRVEVKPQPGPLTFAEGRVPTPFGPIDVRWEKKDSFVMELTLPAKMRARVRLPATASGKRVFVNRQLVAATRDGDWWHIDEPLFGVNHVELRPE